MVLEHTPALCLEEPAGRTHREVVQMIRHVPINPATPTPTPVDRVCVRHRYCEVATGSEPCGKCFQQPGWVSGVLDHLIQRDEIELHLLKRHLLDAPDVHSET